MDYTDHFLIDVSKGHEIIDDNLNTLSYKNTRLEESLGLVLAQDIFSPINLPFFSQSSFDGFALIYNDMIKGKAIEIIGEIPAGDQRKYTIKPNQAYKILTGAPIPQGADTILLQEHAKIENNCIVGSDKILIKGNGFRKKGVEIKSGIKALGKGEKMTPAKVGFLASMGIHKIACYPKPKISLLVTGDELVKLGGKLKFGQVFQANSFALQAALQDMGLDFIHIHYVPDDLQQLKKVMESSILESDMVIISGGISVGKYDYTLSALLENKVKVLFHKIKQKPGKPILIGKKNQKWLLALPGNPASILSTFYLYVRKILYFMMGRSLEGLTLKAQMAESYKKNAGIAHFLKGKLQGNTVNVLPGQESFKLSSFCQANVLIEIDADLEKVAGGEWVRVHRL